MAVDVIPLIAGAIVLIASIISLRLGISVAIVEILLGVIAGHYGFQSSIFLRRMTRFIKIIVHPSSSFARCGGTEKLKEPMLSRNKTLRQFAEFLRKVLQITKTHALKSAQSLVITNK